MRMTLPGCAIRGPHSRDAHMTYCRPAIDTAWSAILAELRRTARAMHDRERG